MKVKVKLRKNIDTAKKLNHQTKLNKISETARKGQLSLVPNPRTKVTVKVKGDMRGMHNAINPPSSEQMKKVRAMRKFYNKQMPTLQCSNCAFSSSCPQYKAGYECAFLPFLNSHKVESIHDLMCYMKELLGANMRRAHVMMLMETLEGSKPTLETSEALNTMFMQLKVLHETMVDDGSASITVETEDNSLIGRLFGSLDQLIQKTEESSRPCSSLPAAMSASNLLELENSKGPANDPLEIERVAREEEQVSQLLKAKSQQESENAKLPQIEVQSL